MKTKTKTEFADFEFSEEFRKEFSDFWALLTRVVGELADTVRKNLEDFNKWLPIVVSYSENDERKKAIIWMALSHVSRHSLKKNGRLLTKIANRILRDTKCPDEIFAGIMNVIYVIRPYVDLMTMDEFLKYISSVGKLVLATVPGLERLNELSYGLDDDLNDDDDDNNDGEENKFDD